MAPDETYQHKEWLGLLQPVGLVVSPPALLKAQAGIDRSVAVELQQRLAPLVDWGTIEDFPQFCEEILEWMPDDLVPEPGLEVVLPDYGETLRPSYGVPDGDRYLMLIQCLDYPFDEITPEAEKGWKVTPQAKFERLLRETGIPTGLLFNGEALRLVYAPRGESSGHITFPVAAMTEVAGRPILSALYMLLGADRLFNVPVDAGGTLRARRLNAILSDSRQYQAEVSTKLAGQVLDALWELLRGFQAADNLAGGALLRELEDAAHIYGGLIAVLMRLVFLLYAEDKGLMPDDQVYQQISS